MCFTGKGFFCILQPENTVSHGKAVAQSRHEYSFLKPYIKGTDKQLFKSAIKARKEFFAMKELLQIISSMQGDTVTIWMKVRRKDSNYFSCSEMLEECNVSLKSHYSKARDFDSPTQKLIHSLLKLLKTRRVKQIWSCIPKLVKSYNELFPVIDPKCIISADETSCFNF